MVKKLNCIMLVDDNADDNFFHERAIRSSGATDLTVVKQNGEYAIEYLRACQGGEGVYPELIFLDVNMPCMDGWGFLEEYSGFEIGFQSRSAVVMLTTSDNLVEKDRALAYSFVADFLTKPLTPEMLEEITNRHF